MDEESIGEVTVSDDTRYWVYTINNKSWTTLTEYFETADEFYIPTFKEANVKENDIIIVYLKGNGTNNGYVAIIKTLNPLCENKNIKIFKDNTANKYCVELDTLSILQRPFKLKEITSYLLGDKNFKSVASYRSKYMSGDLLFLQLPKTLGKSLITGLYSLSDDFEEKSIQKQEEKIKKEEEKRRKKEDEKKPKNKHKVSIRVKKKESNDLTKSNVQLKDFEIVEDEYSEYESSGSEDEFVSFEQDAFEEDLSLTPMIPIMFNPCKNFKWYNECSNDNDFLNEFKKHCKKCAKCEFNNNGDKGLEGFIDNAKLEHEVAFIEDTGFEDVMNAYQSATEFMLPESNTTKHVIRLYLIDEEDHLYYRCILIEWGIRSSTFIKAKVKSKKNVAKHKIKN